MHASTLAYISQTLIQNMKCWYLANTECKLAVRVNPSVAIATRLFYKEMAIIVESLVLLTIQQWISEVYELWFNGHEKPFVVNVVLVLLLIVGHKSWGMHARIGCLLYSVTVSVLYNVDTFICIKRFCNLVISQTNAIFRSLTWKGLQCMGESCLVYINFGTCKDAGLERIDRVL